MMSLNSSTSGSSSFREKFRIQMHHPRLLLNLFMKLKQSQSLILAIKMLEISRK